MGEVYESVRRPDFLLEFFAGNHLTGMLEENLEDLEGLNLKLDANPVFTQLPGTQVGIEVAEANARRR